MTRANDRSPLQRIGLVADGTRGDLYPMLALARRLAQRGHAASVVGPPDFAEVADAMGVDYRAIGRNVREFLTVEASSLHGGALAVAKTGQRHVTDIIEEHFRELPAALEGVDTVVAAGTQMVAASIAELLGAQYHYVAYYPALFPCSESPPAFVPNQALPRWANRLAWWFGERMMRRGFGEALDRGRSNLGLPPVRDLFDYVFGPAPLLATDPELARPPQTRFDARPVGCLHPFEEAALPEKLEAFLSAGEAPVYVGFGSMTDPAPVATTRVVLQALERAGARAVLSAGWAGLGETALPEHVTCVGNVSHASLFRRVAVVVHHGGAGTTTTAARAGVPQILLPHLLDQFWWSRRIEQLGLGPPGLPRRKLAVAPLAERLASLRDNEMLSEHAAHFGSQLRQALRDRPDPALAVL